MGATQQPSQSESRIDESTTLDESEMAAALASSQSASSVVDSGPATPPNPPQGSGWRGLAVGASSHQSIWHHATASESAGPPNQSAAIGQASTTPKLSAKQQRAQDKKRHRTSKRTGPNPQHPHCRKSDRPREGLIPERARRDSGEQWDSDVKRMEEELRKQDESLSSPAPPPSHPLQETLEEIEEAVRNARRSSWHSDTEESASENFKDELDINGDTDTSGDESNAALVDGVWKSDGSRHTV